MTTGLSRQKSASKHKLDTNLPLLWTEHDQNQDSSSSKLPQNPLFRRPRILRSQFESSIHPFAAYLILSGRDNTFDFVTILPHPE